MNKVISREYVEKNYIHKDVIREIIDECIPKRKIVIKAQDELGKTNFNGKKISMQKAFDEVYLYLKENHPDQEYIWNIEMIKKWGKVPASDKQITMIKRFMKDFDTENLNKMQATQILNRLFYR